MAAPSWQWRAKAIRRGRRNGELTGGGWNTINTKHTGPAASATQGIAPSAVLVVRSGSMGPTSAMRHDEHGVMCAKHAKRYVSARSPPRSPVSLGPCGRGRGAGEHRQRAAATLRRVRWAAGPCARAGLGTPMLAYLLVSLLVHGPEVIVVMHVATLNREAHRMAAAPQPRCMR